MPLVLKAQIVAPILVYKPKMEHCIKPSASIVHALSAH